MTHPSHAYFLLFCEEGLISGMFLSGGRLITFLDSVFIAVCSRRFAVFLVFFINGNSPLHLARCSNINQLQTCILPGDSSLQAFGKSKFFIEINTKNFIEIDICV